MKMITISYLKDGYIRVCIQNGTLQVDSKITRKNIKAGRGYMQFDVYAEQIDVTENGSAKIATMTTGRYTSYFSITMPSSYVIQYG